MKTTALFGGSIAKMHPMHKNKNINKNTKKYVIPLLLFAVFETVAVALWLLKGDIFFLLNFSYIGICISIGLFLYAKNFKGARRFVQLFVGTYMLVYLGLVCHENMNLEGFWYYLFIGVFQAAVIHYCVAKIFGPLIFGRGWCGYACWTAMVLDFLPFKTPSRNAHSCEWNSREMSSSKMPSRERNLNETPLHEISSRETSPRERNSHEKTLHETSLRKAPSPERKKLGWIRYIVFAASFAFVAALFLLKVSNIDDVMFWAFIVVNVVYYAVGIAMAFAFQDNRAFCKYFCPITVFLKPMSYFSLLRVKCKPDNCNSCGACLRACPMGVDCMSNSRNRRNATECIMCMECVRACPKHGAEK